MQTKLTLRLDARLIRRAKLLAKQRQKSVSELVAGYFETMADDESASESVSRGLPPLTRRLVGALAGNPVDEKDYRAYLESKHR